MLTKKETMSIQKLLEIPEIDTLFSYNDEGKPTGVSISANKGFYLRVNYWPDAPKFPWRFSEPCPLPARRKAYYFTLRHMIHKALNWMDLAKIRA